MTISELEKYFASSELPVTISIKQGEHITDVRAFVNSHIEVVKNNGTQGAFSAFYDRLYILRELLEHGEHNED